MSIRWIRLGAILFFLLFIVAVTWPGMTPGNRIFPLVLGLPFSMVWIASWVVLSFLVLILLDTMEGRARAARGSDTSGNRPGSTGPEEPRSGEGG